MEYVDNDCIVKKNKYFLICDNKENRRFVSINSKSIKMNKKEIDLTFFENKYLNTFWEVDEDEQFKEITDKQFFDENLCKILYIIITTITIILI